MADIECFIAFSLPFKFIWQLEMQDDFYWQSSFCNKGKTVRVNRLVRHAQKTEWWLMVVQILALATYTGFRGSFANLVARGCITQWWQLHSSMSIVMLLSAIAACNLLKLTYKLCHMGWHYNLCHIQLPEPFSHPNTLWCTNPGYELISEYNSEYNLPITETSSMTLSPLYGAV